MNLGIFLPLGESLTGMAKSGQDVRFVNYYLDSYSKNFDNVYVFTYKKETYPNLPENCHLICPSEDSHRYFYGLKIPFEHKEIFLKCDVSRCFHPSSTVPAIVGKLVFGKKFIFNYNYDYIKWAKIENKSYLIPLIWTAQIIAFKTSDFVFVADEKMENYVQKYKSKDKIKIIRNGVDVNLFKKTEVKKNKIPLIFSVGRLETQKNYLQLIEAVALLNKKAKLFLVGNGPLKNDLEKKAKELKVELEIKDVVPNNKLPGFYSAADVYVQPSLIEAPVKTLLEAMSCEAPCVATNVPGISDVIKNGEDGVLAELSAENLSEKIAYLLTESKKAKDMGKKARLKIAKKYNLLKFLEIENETLKSV